MSVGGRIRLGRKAAGLSQRALAGMCGVSAMAISKFERDAMMPSSSNLLAIARALQVSTEFLLRSSKVNLSQPIFRCKKSIPAKQQAAVLARAQEHVEQYLEVEEMLSASPVYVDPQCASRTVLSVDDIEDAARGLRSEWGLGQDPIENLMEVLEERGIKVAIVDAHAAFDALSVRMSNGAPVIVVKGGVDGDRQRFTLAHELGHLVLRCGPDVEPEKVANRFAGALLVPRDGALAELGEHRSRLDWQELRQLKLKHGMSIAAWIYRAKDLGIITGTYSQYLFRVYKSRGWHRQEPCRIEPETTTRMSRLVKRAVAEGLVSRTKAMELGNAMN